MGRDEGGRGAERTMVCEGNAEPSIFNRSGLEDRKMRRREQGPQMGEGDEKEP